MQWQHRGGERRYEFNDRGTDLFGWEMSTKSPRLVFWATRAWIGFDETGTTLTTEAGTGACVRPIFATVVRLHVQKGIEIKVSSCIALMKLHTLMAVSTSGALSAAFKDCCCLGAPWKRASCSLDRRNLA